MWQISILHLFYKHYVATTADLIMDCIYVGVSLKCWSGFWNHAKIGTLELPTLIYWYRRIRKVGTWDSSGSSCSLRDAGCWWNKDRLKALTTTTVGSPPRASITPSSRDEIGHVCVWWGMDRACPESGSSQVPNQVPTIVHWTLAPFTYYITILLAF